MSNIIMEALRALREGKSLKQSAESDLERYLNSVSDEKFRQAKAYLSMKSDYHGDIEDIMFIPQKNKWYEAYDDSVIISNNESLIHYLKDDINILKYTDVSQYVSDSITGIECAFDTNGNKVENMSKEDCDTVWIIRPEEPEEVQEFIKAYDKHNELSDLIEDDVRYIIDIQDVEGNNYSHDKKYTTEDAAIKAATKIWKARKRIFKQDGFKITFVGVQEEYDDGVSGDYNWTMDELDDWTDWDDEYYGD